MNSSITLKKAILYAIIGGLVLSVAHIYSNPFQSATFHAKSRRHFNKNNHDAKFEQEPIGNNLSDELKQKIKQDIEQICINKRQAIEQVFINKKLDKKLEQILKDKADHQLPIFQLSTDLQAKLNAHDSTESLTLEEKKELSTAVNEYSHKLLPILLRQLDYTHQVSLRLMAKASVMNKLKDDELKKATELILQVNEVRKQLRQFIPDIDQASLSKVVPLTNLCFCLTESLNTAIATDFKEIKPLAQEQWLIINQDVYLLASKQLFTPGGKFIWDSLEFAVLYNNKLLRQIGEKTQLIGAPWYQRAFYTVKTDGPSYLLGATIGGLMYGGIEALTNLINSFRN